MKAVIFSDIHGQLAALVKLMSQPADAFFAAGDLVNWGRGLEAVGEAMLRFCDGKPERIHVMPGNHESATDIERFCRQFDFINFHGATVELGGLRFAGFGYSTPTPFDTPGEMGEDEMRVALSKFAGYQPDVLICHSPPFETPLDRIHEGLHAGSRAVREFIEKHEPEYFFCGHIHEAEGMVFEMGATRAMNVGKKGYLLEI